MRPVDSKSATAQGARGPAAVLHDVGNLLAVTHSLVERLGQALDHHESTEAQGLLHQVAATVNEAIAVGRRPSPRGAHLRVNALAYVAEHASALASLFPHPASLTVSLRPDPEGTDVAIHPTDLLRILTNLVKNAAQACGELGTAQISVATVRPTTEMPVRGSILGAGTYVQVIVSDTGPGFGRRGPRVAPPLGQSLPPKRTGLGLTVVEELLHEVGGGLVLGDRPTGGAEAQVWLPLARAATGSP